MEGKDITEIANAVSTAITKLNADTAAKEKKDNEEKPGIPEEIFKCPECDATVKGGIAFCQSCGCALEWGE
jgi:hypothetical protein